MTTVLWILANLMLLPGATALSYKLLHGSRTDTPTILVAIGVIAASQVVLIGEALGYAMLLSDTYFAIAMLTCSVGLLVTFPREAKAAIDQTRRRIYACRQASHDEPWPIRLGLAVVGVSMLVMLLTTLVQRPLNLDALWYRLARIGYWRQEGGFLYEANSLGPPCDYYPVGGGLLMQWLDYPWVEDFWGVVNLSSLSALLLLLAMWSLMTQLGFSRVMKIAAILFFLAMPILPAHAMSSQDDLPLTAFLTAGFALILQSRRSRNALVIGWLAIGLACSIKVSALMWLPSLGIMILSTAWAYRMAVMWLVRNAVWGAVCIGIIALPQMALNLERHNHPLAPRAKMAKETGDDNGVWNASRAGYNLLAYSLLTLTPANNPFIPNTVVQSLYQAGRRLLPEEDSDQSQYLEFQTYQAMLDQQFATGGHNVLDYKANSGAIHWVVILIGIAFLLSHAKLTGQSERRLMFAMLLACGLFASIYLGALKWYAINWRFALPMLPLLMLIAILPLAKSGTRTAHIIVVILSAWTSYTMSEIYLTGKTVGYQGAVDGGWDLPHQQLMLAQKQVSASLGNGKKLGVVVSREAFVAGYFYPENGANIHFFVVDAIAPDHSASDFIQYNHLDAVVTRPDVFPGGSGASQIQIFHPRNSPDHIRKFSIYTPIEPESVRPYIRKEEVLNAPGSGAIKQEWTILNAKNASFGIQVDNPTNLTWLIATSLQPNNPQKLPPGTTITLPIQASNYSAELGLILVPQGDGRGKQPKVTLIDVQALVSTQINY